MKNAYQINTQNVEQYGTNFYKYKGGSTYIISFDVKKEIFEKDAYGPGNHSYYHVPSVTEASACALVMQHVNRFNGLSGSFDYITGVETVPFEESESAYFVGSFDDLVAEIESEKAVA
jgi:hypothetical protein